METAKSVINDALQEILVQQAEQSIQPVDFQTAKRYLNRMMATTPFNGLGYTVIVNPDDLITIPDAALDGVISNLAKRLLASYDMPLTAELMMCAKYGLQEIRRIAVKVLPSSMPCTLPLGSGNEPEGATNLNQFYSCPADELLAEGGGSILLESNNNE